MTANELQEFMLMQGCWPRNRMVADAQYAHPTEEWIFREYASALKTLFFQLGQTLWKAEQNDCDDFARLAAAFAQSLHHRTGARPNTALAVGEFWYKSPQGPHAIVCAVPKVGDEFKLVFLEPQNYLRANLTSSEVNSCIAYRF